MHIVPPTIKEQDQPISELRLFSPSCHQRMESEDNEDDSLEENPSDSDVSNDNWIFWHPFPPQLQHEHVHTWCLFISAPVTQRPGVKNDFVLFHGQLTCAPTQGHPWHHTSSPLPLFWPLLFSLMCSYQVNQRSEPQDSHMLRSPCDSHFS